MNDIWMTSVIHLSVWDRLSQYMLVKMCHWKPNKSVSHRNQYGKRVRTKSQLSQRDEEQLLGQHVLLNCEHLLLSVWWVCCPDPTADKLLLDHVQLRWTSPAGVPLLPCWDTAAPAVSGQPEQSIQPPQAGIQLGKQLSLDSQSDKGLLIQHGWNLLKRMFNRAWMQQTTRIIWTYIYFHSEILRIADVFSQPTDNSTTMLSIKSIFH